MGNGITVVCLSACEHTFTGHKDLQFSAFGYLAQSIIVPVILMGGYDGVAKIPMVARMYEKN